MAFDQELRAYLETLQGEPHVETYANENYLVRRDLGFGTMGRTPLGDAYLRLRGRYAVQWLLTVEVAQSTGRADPWRVSHGVLEEAMAPSGIVRTALADFLPTRDVASATIKRMTDLRVLDDRVDLTSRATVYFVPSAMRDVVAAALHPGPWRSAVDAVLAGEREAVVPGLRPSASAATIEQTRMIAHEVRNALVPARHHIDALLQTIGNSKYRPRIEAARRGVVRVLDFVDQLVATADLVGEPATTLDGIEVVGEAIARIDGGERVQVLPASPNAVQATTAPQPIRLQLARRDRAVRIVVDDGGPGVPEVDRSRIFDDGFTTRSGGSGFGLALVKRIVEDTLRGKVWCEASDLGGARFVIELPVDAP